MNFLPAHALSCYLAHNPHQIAGMTIEEFLEDEWNDAWGLVFPSEEERKLALLSGSLWILHWYDEPAKLKAVAASSLEAIAAHLEREKIGTHRETPRGDKAP